jgi:hypothetical protein
VLGPFARSLSDIAICPFGHGSSLALASRRLRRRHVVLPVRRLTVHSRFYGREFKTYSNLPQRVGELLRSSPGFGPDRLSRPALCSRIPAQVFRGLTAGRLRLRPRGRRRRLQSSGRHNRLKTSGVRLNRVPATFLDVNPKSMPTDLCSGEVVCSPADCAARGCRDALRRGYRRSRRWRCRRGRGRRRRDIGLGFRRDIHPDIRVHGAHVGKRYIGAA